MIVKPIHSLPPPHDYSVIYLSSIAGIIQGQAALGGNKTGRCTLICADGPELAMLARKRRIHV